MMKILFEKKYIFFLGTYISFVMFIIFAAMGQSIAMQISKTSTILMFGMFLFQKSDENTITFEKAVLSIFILVFNILMLMRGRMQGDYEIYNTICGITLILVTGIYLWRNHGGIGIKKWFYDNKAILLVIVCFILLSIEVIDSLVMWDAWQYYARWGIGCIQEITKLFDSNFSGIYSLYLAGHASLGYSLWAILSQLFAEGTASLQIADITLACVSILAYYQILRKLLDKKYTNETLALVAAPYALSPFVLGIVGNISVDSATMYFAVIFIACVLYNYEALELVFAFAFCFTKEPAVIYYVTFIIAKVVCDYLSEHKFNLWGVIKYGFCNIKNYLYAIPAILWLILFKFNLSAGWRIETEAEWNYFGWNTDIVPLKLKQIFYLNFNWVFWLIIVLGIVLQCIKRVRVNIKIFKLIPVSVMGLSVIVFGCVYVTYLLPRYIVPMIPALYLTATVVIDHLNKRSLQIFTVLVSALLFVQSYYVIDPVMISAFSSRPIGYESDLVRYVIEEYAYENRFDDHIVYNRQNIYWSETIEEVFMRSGYNGNMLIVLPDYTSQYGILGNHACLWNTKTKRLEYYDKSLGIPQGCTMVTTCSVADASSRMGEMSSNYILYIVPAWCSMDLGFIADNSILMQGEVEHKGYGVQYIVMDLEYKPIDDGKYLVSPKQNDSLSICTDGTRCTNLFLEHNINAVPLNLKYKQTRYEFVFDEYDLAMDVKGSRIDENGTVWTWDNTGADSQRWFLEKVGDYYIICWHGYALTYDLNDNSMRLTPKTGEDNQLWLFTK